MRNTKKQRQYNLLLTTVAFVTIMIAILIAVSLNKKQQVFYSEAQNFAKHAALYLAEKTTTPGSSIHILVYAEKTVDLDWIGLYPIQGDQVPVSKHFLKDCDLRIEGGAEVGYCDFAAPDVTGVYVFRLYRDNLFVTSTNPINVIPVAMPATRQDPATCTPQPPCLRQSPACVLPVPVNGWCPVAD